MTNSVFSFLQKLFCFEYKVNEFYTDKHPALAG